jgi:hypothetical protein
MALTAAVRYEKRPASQIEMKVVSTETVYVGAMVNIQESTGRVLNLSDTANEHPMGLVVELVPLDASDGNVTGTAGGAERVVVETASVILMDVSVAGVTAETDVGDHVYMTDENTFTLTPTANIPAVGELVRWDATTIGDVMLYSHEVIRN